jgi:hypothetical protein
MSFKLLYTNLAGPQGDFLVDPSATFEAGQIGTLGGSTTGSPLGLPVVSVAATGTSGLLGIIDDNKNTQFIATVVNEVLASGASTFAHANVVSGTVATTGTIPSAISYTNGSWATPVTYAQSVSYSYIIPGKAGDDTTLASGKCTLWLQPGEYATDVYEVATGTNYPATYSVNAPLYVSANGKLTPASGAQVVGRVTKAPSAGNPFLNFYKI